MEGTAGGKLTLSADRAHGAIAFTGNTAGTGLAETANSVHLEKNTGILLDGNGAVYFDDPIASGDTGGNALTMTNGGMAQFAGNNYLNQNGKASGGVDIRNGTFRVVDGAAFESGLGRFNVGADGMLAGGGSIAAGNGFIIAGTLSPDSDRFQVPADLRVTDIPAVARDQAIGTLTLAGDVSLNGATLEIDLNSGGASDLIAVTGSVSYLGGDEKINLSEWHNGTYTIMTADGGIDLGQYDTDRITLQGKTLHHRQKIVVAGDAKNLVLRLEATNADLVWAGNTDVWEYGKENWKNGIVDSDFIAGDYAIFNSDGSGTVTVQDGGVSTSGMEIVSGNYVFTGDEIRGAKYDVAGGVPKNTGMVHIMGGNVDFRNSVNFAGGVRIESGAQAMLSHDGDFGVMNIENHGDLAFAHDREYTHSGVISGIGDTSKTGSGLLTITGANASSGTFTQSAGDVLLTGSWTGSYSQDSGAGRFTAGSAVAGAVIGGRLAVNGNVEIVNQLNVGSLDIGSGSHLDFALRGASDYGTIIAQDNVRIDGGKNISLNLGAWINGTYDLIQAGESMDPLAPGLFSSITVGGMEVCSRQTADLIMNNGDKTLQIVLNSGDNVNLHWNGGGSDWDTSSSYWTTDNVDNVDTFAHGDKVYFDDGIADNNITLAGNATVSGMVVSGDYNFTGGSIIGIDAGITGGKVLPTGQLEINKGTTAFSDINLDFVNGVAIGGDGAMVVKDGVGIADGMAFEVDGRLEFAQDGDSTFANTITGDGVLDKSGSGSFTFAGDGSGFTGKTEVGAGMLIVGGNLGGAVAVNNGATLTGDGSIGGDVEIRSGGVVTAGNGTSSGTLSIAGNLTLSAGSFYDVIVNPGNQNDSTLLAVTGSVNLGGATVRHVGTDGAYSPIGTWTIVTAGGGLGDTRFSDSALTKYAFLDASLIYDPDDHWVKLRLERKKDSSFTDNATSGNQKEVAEALEDAKDTPLHNQVLTLGRDGNIGDVYDQLSGEMYASMGTMIMGYDREFQNTLRRGRFGGSECERVEGYPIWASLDGYHARIDGNGNAAKTRLEGMGVSVGGEFSITHNWLAGGAFRFGDTDVKVDERYSKTDVKSYSVGVYAAGKAGSWRPVFGATYGHHQAKSTRNIVRPELAQRLNASHALDSMQAFGEIGYEVMLSDAFSFMPYAGASWNGVWNGGYKESGGTAALAVRDGFAGNVFSDLGIRGEYRVGSKVAIGADLAWEHAYGKLERTGNAAFMGSRNFGVKGVAMERNAARATLSGQMEFESGFGMEVGYSGRIAGNEVSHSGQFSVKFSF